MGAGSGAPASPACWSPDVTLIAAGSLATLFAMKESVAEPTVNVRMSWPPLVPSVQPQSVTLPSVSETKVDDALPPPESLPWTLACPTGLPNASDRRATGAGDTSSPTRPLNVAGETGAIATAAPARAVASKRIGGRPATVTVS